MVKYEPAQYIKLKRNPDYWMRDEQNAPLPYLEEQTILIVQNQDTELLKFLAGEIDLLNPRPEDVPDLRDRAEALRINVSEIGLDSGALFVTFNRNPNHYERNGKRDPRLTWFTDKQFLRALAHGIDKPTPSCSTAFTDSVNRPWPTSRRRTSFSTIRRSRPTSTISTRPAACSTTPVTSTATATASSKIAMDNPIAFTLNTNAGNQVREKMCSIIKEDWTRLGINVNYRPLDWTLLNDKLDVTLDWDAILIGFTGGTRAQHRGQSLRSSGNLHMWYPNEPKPATAWEAEIDALLDKGSREIDPLKRQPFYWRIQEILHDELPLLMLVQQKRFRAYKNTLENFIPTVWGTYHPERLRFAR